MHHGTDLEQMLNKIQEEVVKGVVQQGQGHILEGMVMTVGPAPYRRLDARGRALAYIRTRPRKQAVRIDVSGLWLLPRPSSLQIPSSSGGATLLLRHINDVPKAVQFLVEAVSITQTAEAQFETRKVDTVSSPNMLHQSAA